MKTTYREFIASCAQGEKRQKYTKRVSAETEPV